MQPSLAAGCLEENLALIAGRVERSVQSGRIDILVLPECFNGTFDSADGSVSQSSRSFLSALAVKHETCVIGGSVEWRAPNGRLYNTTFVYDRSGREVGSYHKRMLFGREAERRAVGDSEGIFELEGWRVGVLNCADCWHPELARELLHRVDLICVPAETVVPQREHMIYARTLWHNLAFTRAEENSTPLVVADWAAGALNREVVDDDPERDRCTYGAATIVDPSMRPDLNRIQQTIEAGDPGELTAELNWERLVEFRAYRRRVGLLPARDA